MNQPALSESKSPATAASVGGGALADILDVLSKNDSSVREEIKDAVDDLIDRLRGDRQYYSKGASDALEKVELAIADIDERLSAQMNEIIHADKFQKLEGTWRGLHQMVQNTETSDKLKIKVLNVNKEELRSEFKGRSVSGWDQTELFKKVYGAEYDMPGGKPYGVIIGDYEFGPSSQDVDILRGMAKIAATAHAPFIAAAAPGLLGLDSWTEINNPRGLAERMDPSIHKTHIAWDTLRQEEDARYLGLTMPRVLARLPYGERTGETLKSFSFEEDTDGSDHGKYCWANAAYAFGANVNRAFYEYGWTTRIRGLESGGRVDYLPTHIFPTDDGQLDYKCPTEIAIGDRRENELSNLGLIPLSHYKDTDYACFFGAQSLKRPTEYMESEATANEKLGCNLPYMFACCRFAHYLKSMLRDWIGKDLEEGPLQTRLNNWIQNYVGQREDEAGRAMQPLAAASVKVLPVEGSPGYYRAVFELRPHYQLENVNVTLRLVSTGRERKQ